MKKNYAKIVKCLLLLFVMITILLSCKKKTEIMETTIAETTKKEEETQIIKSGTYFDTISQRATMEVSYKEGIYYFNINWGSSASENTNWKFSGIYNKGYNAVAYRDCICVEEIYDENGNCEKKEKFRGGFGLMKNENGKLYWDDFTEEKIYDDKYNGIFEMPVEGFTNTQPPINYNITNNYYNGNPMNNGYSYDGYVNNGDHRCVFFIAGYDREPYKTYNGEAMITRYPIISGNNLYLVNMANGLIPNAYVSINTWCKDHLRGNNLQGFFLNKASINSYTNTMIYMTVNCALQKRGVLNGNVEFRLELNLANNRYYWERIRTANEINQSRKYDRDSIIIIE